MTEPDMTAAAIRVRFESSEIHDFEEIHELPEGTTILDHYGATWRMHDGTLIATGFAPHTTPPFGPSDLPAEVLHWGEIKVEPYTPTTQEICQDFVTSAAGVGVETQVAKEQFYRWYNAEMKASAQSGGATEIRRYADSLGVDGNAVNDDSEWWDGYRAAQRGFIAQTSRHAKQIEEG
ncbi:MAG: hypothetical protein HLX51_00780 [Micrococcaceae bacterium]|nr:hypothetical protein [Micrococcaceae bacterium]